MLGYYSGFSRRRQCLDLGTGSLSTVASGFPVQSSIVVMGDGTGTDYLYFNTALLTVLATATAMTVARPAARSWATKGDNYALGGMAIDNGYAVFSNDKITCMSFTIEVNTKSSWGANTAAMSSLVEGPWLYRGSLRKHGRRRAWWGKSAFSCLALTLLLSLCAPGALAVEPTDTQLKVVIDQYTYIGSVNGKSNMEADSKQMSL